MVKNKKWVKRLDEEMEKNVEEVTKLTARIQELESLSQDLIMNQTTTADPVSSRHVQIVEPCSPSGTVRYSNMSKSDLVYLHQRSKQENDLKEQKVQKQSRQIQDYKKEIKKLKEDVSSQKTIQRILDERLKETFSSGKFGNDLQKSIQRDVENVRQIEKLRSKLLQRANDYGELQDKYIALKTQFKIISEREDRDKQIAIENRKSAASDSHEYVKIIKEMDEKLLILQSKYSKIKVKALNVNQENEFYNQALLLTMQKSRLQEK